MVDRDRDRDCGCDCDTSSSNHAQLLSMPCHRKRFHIKIFASERGEIDEIVTLSLLT